MPPRKKTTPAELGPVMQRIVDDEAARREDFIDRAAIALFAAGWPAKTLWQRAEQLWASRVRYKQGEVIQ